MKILFFTSLFVIVYTYAVYPVLIWLVSLVFRKPVKNDQFRPGVSILISAYNEQPFIEDKIRSIAFLDYPQELVEVLIGSDGSSDHTVEILNKYKKANFRVIEFKERRGKPAVLNELAMVATNEILVFTDSRQELSPASLKNLVRNFSDKKVGSVSSQLFFVNKSRAGEGIGAYWAYEKFIRSCESKVHSMLGATGAMYALRKELFKPMPVDTLLDDLYLPFIAVRAGFRAIFEPEAEIFDIVSKDARSEFVRKERTLAGNFQIFKAFPDLFNLFKSPIAIQLFSHKFLRLTVPYFLAGLYGSNVLLLAEPAFFVFFVLQNIFYFSAMFAALTAFKNPVFSVAQMFCVMNAAAVSGFVKFLLNKPNAAWKKTT